MLERVLARSVSGLIGHEIRMKGWIYHYRVLPKTVFIVLKDMTGTVQIVASSEQVSHLSLKLDDVVEIRGKVRPEARSKAGYEVELTDVWVLNSSAHDLPFHSSSEIRQVGMDVVLDHRPLSLRTEKVAETFKIQADILELFRSFLRKNYFTEIVTSKIVSGGTEGGTNLFEIRYFEKAAYLAQSPQFFKEHGVAGLERVFETGHVYRAEPHATRRHLTEYYSLDLEIGFIEGPEDIIAFEKALLSEMFQTLNSRYGESIQKHSGALLPHIANAPIWEFQDCLERLQKEFNRQDLTDDLDPEAERQLCTLAQEELGVPAVFVLGFPLGGRPFYTHPRGDQGASQSFDLLFRGVEITTGGQRLHTRESLEKALKTRGMDPAAFEGHLRMFDLGMPPHGGLAIGLERLTAQILGLSNIREATLYPRDRQRLKP